jgi:phosphatidylserine decarboxylase
MTLRSAVLRLFEQEHVNFLLTNRVIPRRLATRFMAWFSKIEQPLVRDLSIALWRFFSNLDLSEAKAFRFRSMHDCFTRELKDGARPIDVRPEIVRGAKVVAIMGDVRGLR